jgi:hypothetical protein
MTPERWDVDTAVVERTTNELDSTSAWRYGVTGWETTHPEPLDVVLAQEDPDPDLDAADDEQWCMVDGPDEFPGRLVADEKVRDDDYAVVVEDADDFSAEELAMHVVLS